MENTHNPLNKNQCEYEILQRNRNVVRTAQAMESQGMTIYKEGDAVIGCVYRSDGYYTKHYLKPDMDNIARFICSSDSNKLLCNSSDYAIACTMGNFIDLAVQDFLNKILPYVEIYQEREEHPTFTEFE